MNRRKTNLAAIATTVVLSFALRLPMAHAVDDLSLNVSGATTVQPGDVLTVTLDVANLSEPINGVQALIQYDTAVFTLTDVVPTDLGFAAPAEGWVEVYFDDVAGDLTYAVVINGASTSANGTVATLTFSVIGEGATAITFRPDASPFQTKLTAAQDSTTILPNKIDSATITSTCDDGEFCNGQETVVGGVCEPGTPPDCSVLTDQCNDGVCNETTDSGEAVPVNEGGICDDGDLCTTGDTCLSGSCTGTAVDCSSLDDACNVGTCDPADGSCVATPTNEGGSCDDGLFCNGADTCSSGTCVSAGDPCAPLTCDETADACVSPIHIDALEVFYAGRFLRCAGGSNDGGVCTGDADCPSGVCQEQGDSSKTYLSSGSTATFDNITNYQRGITGVRITFSQTVDFATTAADALTFAWTDGSGTTFSAVTDVATTVSVTPTVVNGVTVLEVVLADDHVRRRWLRVTVDATQVTVSGVELDGELMGNPILLPSGDGNPGGDAVFYLGNVPGDVDQDGKNQLRDIGLIRQQVNPFLNVAITNVFDVDKDGKVQLRDVGDARADVNPFFALPLLSP